MDTRSPTGMRALRTLLIVFTAVIFAYTAITIARHGLGFLGVAFGILPSFEWLGQFTVDFGMYLALSALWIAWRGGYTAASLAMAALAGVLGMMVFAPYLLWLIRRTNGDVHALLMGVHAHTR